jgi:hypothetical protein
MRGVAARLLTLLGGGLVGAEGGNAARQRAQHAARAAEDAEVLHEAQRDAAQLALHSGAGGGAKPGSGEL